MSVLKGQKYHKWITEADILDSKRVTVSTLIVGCTSTGESIEIVVMHLGSRLKHWRFADELSIVPGENQCIVSGVIGVSGASSVVSDITNLMVDGDRSRHLYIRYYRLQRSNRPNSNK